MPQDDISYGPVQSAEDLGRLARAHRKQRHLTLETVRARQFQHALSVGVRAGQGNGRGRQDSKGTAHPGAGGHHPAARAGCIVRRWITKIRCSLTMYFETFNQRIFLIIKALKTPYSHSMVAGGLLEMS